MPDEPPCLEEATHLQLQVFQILYYIMTIHQCYKFFNKSDISEVEKYKNNNNILLHMNISNIEANQHKQQKGGVYLAKLLCAHLPLFICIV